MLTKAGPDSDAGKMFHPRQNMDQVAQMRRFAQLYSFIHCLCVVDIHGYSEITYSYCGTYLGKKVVINGTG